MDRDWISRRMERVWISRWMDRVWISRRDCQGLDPWRDGEGLDPGTKRIDRVRISWRDCQGLDLQEGWTGIGSWDDGQGLDPEKRWRRFGSRDQEDLQGLHLQEGWTGFRSWEDGQGLDPGTKTIDRVWVASQRPGLTGESFSHSHNPCAPCPRQEQKAAAGSQTCQPAAEPPVCPSALPLSLFQPPFPPNALRSWLCAQPGWGRPALLPPPSQSAEDCGNGSTGIAPELLS